MTASRHRVPLLIACIVRLYSVGAGIYGAPDHEEKCSKALGFNESVGPKDRSFQDLQFCNEHHKRTCCEKNHSRQVLATFGPFSHERSTRCVQMSRLALCSLCDGDVGIGRKSRLNTVLICPTFCKRWFEACSQDLFAPGGSAGVVVPCMPSHVICSPLGEITEDPAAFCRGLPGMAFDVAAAEDEPDHCYDGVPAARSRGKGPKNPYERPKPVIPPWWRRIMSDMSRDMVYLQREMVRRLPRSLQGYMPAIIVGAVGLLFAWCLCKGD